MTVENLVILTNVTYGVGVGTRAEWIVPTASAVHLMALLDAIYHRGTITVGIA